MKSLILITDIFGIWILKSNKGYKNLIKKFSKKRSINFKGILKLRYKLLEKYRNLMRVGKISYYKFEELFFKLIDKKNYKKLTKEYVKF